MNNKPKIKEQFVMKGIVSFPKISEYTNDNGVVIEKFSMSIVFTNESYKMLAAKVAKIKKECAGYQASLCNFRSAQYDANKLEGTEERYVSLRTNLPKKYTWRMRISARIDFLNSIQLLSKTCELAQVQAGDFVVISGVMQPTTFNSNKNITSYLKKINIMKPKAFALFNSEDDSEFTKLAESCTEELSVDEFEKELEEVEDDSITI